MKRILILRPEPGASDTAARARAMGLEPVKAPLFTVRPLAWSPPDPAEFDAVMITSANAVRHGGGGLDRFRHLACYAVGESSAEAARAAGFADVRAGPGGGAELGDRMTADRVRSAFHPCGREHMPVAAPGVRIADVPVYAADPVAVLPGAAEDALAGTPVLLHSPRAASVFGELVQSGRERIALAAISAAAAEAAGRGWARVAVAARPRDEALLALAAELCDNHLGEE